MTGGSNRLLVAGDVFELLPDLDDDSAHCAVVDFPWDFDHENGAGLYAEFYETEPIDRFENLLEELSRVLVDGAWLFAFADDVISPDVRSRIERSRFERRQTCVWDFECMSMGAYHRVAHYPILTATNGETDRYVRDRGTIYRAQRATGAVGIGHERSTAKPVSLYRDILMPPVLREGERLLEPFAGTAPGLAVCHERDLRYWGADTDAEIVDERLSDPEPTSLPGFAGTATDGGEPSDKQDTGVDR